MSRPGGGSGEKLDVRKLKRVFGCFLARFVSEARLAQINHKFVSGMRIKSFSAKCLPEASDQANLARRSSLWKVFPVRPGSADPGDQSDQNARVGEPLGIDLHRGSVDEALLKIIQTPLEI